MYIMEVELKNEAGLHARPASLFVKEASRYASDVKILKNNVSCNAKSIMGILSIGAGKGDNIIIMAEGKDEKQAVKALKVLVDSNFGE